MNKLLVIMFLGSLTLMLPAQNHLPDKKLSGKCDIVLVNPTASNIEIIRFLAEKNILKIKKDKIRFTGIYHKDQAYDFLKSRELVREKNIPDFTFKEITGEIKNDEIFRNNAWTTEFYEIFKNSDGMIFFGGPDIQPEIYNEENTHSIVTDPARHTLEVSLLFHLLGGARNPAFVPFLTEKPDYLITGFCLGLQTMNVATGGTLVQDIPFQVYQKNTPEETLTIPKENLHRNYWQELNTGKSIMGINFHRIFPADHPFFRKEVPISGKKSPLVYSSHHQSIENIGTGFEVTALSQDGKVIEGLVHNQFKNVFGVQFHPEVSALYEHRELWKFTPEDELRTYHAIIGKGSVTFHKKYWKRISEGLKESMKK